MTSEASYGVRPQKLYYGDIWYRIADAHWSYYDPIRFVLEYSLLIHFITIDMNSSAGQLRCLNRNADTHVHWCNIRIPEKMLAISIQMEALRPLPPSLTCGSVIEDFLVTNKQVCYNAWILIIRFCCLPDEPESQTRNLNVVRESDCRQENKPQLVWWEPAKFPSLSHTQRKMGGGAQEL